MPCIGTEIHTTDFMDDALAKSQKVRRLVIPVKAGGKRAVETPIQGFQVVAGRLDPGFHRGDDLLRALHG